MALGIAPILLLGIVAMPLGLIAAPILIAGML